jgi:hypothetical protein
MIPTRTLPPPLPSRSQGRAYEGEVDRTPVGPIPALLKAQRTVTTLEVLLFFVAFWTVGSAILTALGRSGITTTAAYVGVAALLAFGYLRARRRLREIRQQFASPH